MIRHTKDNRLWWGAYCEALEQVETQFALMRFVVKDADDERIKHFYDERLEALNAKLRKRLQGADFQEIGESLQERNRRKYNVENTLANTRFKKELSEDRLNQSELLLLVAHFESFMKEIHKTFLRADPAKAFGTKNTTFELNALFGSDGTKQFDKFLDEQIIKEVKWLDQQRIKVRSDYFLKKYSIGFGSDKEVGRLAEIMDRRNEVTHQLYSSPPSSLDQIKEQPLVGEDILRDARRLFDSIPRKCIDAGGKKYPSLFRPPSV